MKLILTTQTPTRERVVCRVIVVELVLLAIILAVLLAVFLSIVFHELYLNGTVGRIEVVDGVRQNDRVRFSDVYYADGKIHYTLVNQSSAVVTEQSPPWIERKVDGAWVLDTASDKLEVHPNAHHVSAFTDAERVLNADDVWSEVQSGEYRIVSGADLFSRKDTAGKTEWLLRYPEDGYCIVGYFAITEDMLNE